MSKLTFKLATPSLGFASTFGRGVLSVINVYRKADQDYVKAQIKAGNDISTVILSGESLGLLGKEFKEALTKVGDEFTFAPGYELQLTKGVWACYPIASK